MKYEEICRKVSFIAIIILSYIITTNLIGKTIFGFLILPDIAILMNSIIIVFLYFLFDKLKIYRVIFPLIITAVIYLFTWEYLSQFEIYAIIVYIVIFVLLVIIFEIVREILKEVT